MSMFRHKDGAWVKYDDAMAAVDCEREIVLRQLKEWLKWLPVGTIDQQRVKLQVLEWIDQYVPQGEA
jgi:hypothetical protein